MRVQKKLIIFVLLILVPTLVVACDFGAEPEPENDEMLGISEPDAEKVLAAYRSVFEELVEQTGDQGHLAMYNSSEEVEAHFQQAMSPQLAEWFVETYIMETEEGVFLLPMDGPIWLDKERPYEVLKITDTEYQVVQEWDTDYLGHVNIIFVLIHDDEKWVVHDLLHEDLS